MEFAFRMMALCRAGLTEIGEPSAAVAASLFIVGLAGSALHCAGMCGPFVLGQVAADGARWTTPGGEWRRLAGAALVPYHLGRLTTYTLLGLLSGTFTALFASTDFFNLLCGLLLAAGAAFMALQGLGLAAGIASPLGGLLARTAGPLAASHRASARYALGLVLGLLPCGLIYGALGAAAGTGSPWRGGMAMAAFAAGTIPALVLVGWGGAFLKRRLQHLGRWIFAPLLLLNAALMLALAARRLAEI
jgi:uncharacterized protein